MPKKPLAVVAMSGGVDSSVAAGLLQQQGYDVVGVTMRLWTEDDAGAARHHKRCCSVEDTDDARAAADVLGVRHYVINLEREFKDSVVDKFVAEYARGRTPNPCLACNDKVKFRPLLEHAIALGADWLATGHYARASHAESGPHELLRAIDPSKDQSYVLYTLGQEELSRTLFPVGEYPKDEIRRLAHEWSLPNADKPDSADICFIPSGDYRAFVRDRIPVAAGDIVDTDGRTVGEHEGIVNYTVGQRRGVPARGNAQPLFVVDIDADTNRVVIGPHEELMATALVADELTFVDGVTPANDVRVDARIRYRAPAMPATLSVSGETAGVRFETPQRAVTPGQAVVFYDGERVIGGGTIVRRLQ
ncbi:MAG: tRNA 2-thiouridine(34) synthase MnmA [Chloroflexota bacterium]